MKRPFLFFLFIFFTLPVFGQPSVLIEGVPHIRQKPDFCGEACAAMYLQKLGYSVDQDYVFDQSGLDPLKGRGCYTPDLVRALKNIGFDPGKVWYYLDVKKVDKDLEAQWQALYGDLKKGVPSLICSRYSDNPTTSEHIRLVLGYNEKKDEVIYHEPAEGGGAYKTMKKSLFMKIWPLKYRKEKWLVIRIPLDVKKIQIQPSSSRFTNADYAQHIMKLKKKIPHKGFTVILQKPFVVLGDESPQWVRRRATGTVKWAVDHLKKLYFKKDPLHIIDIWLFKNKTSYRKYTKEIFGDEPSTPFGYYTSTHKALIMNIATGGGTLVHEIVHPFMEANFQGYTAWFNEGLASLYEQCGEESGKIHGYTNWRLRGLQKALKGDGVPSFKTLLKTTSDQFYNQDPGTNYAQARYLCYYLQQKNLLVKFYHQFHKNRKKDPSGYKTLQEVLGEKDMKDFQKGWEKFVLGLSFP